jgi:hypothetical protein
MARMFSVVLASALLACSAAFFPNLSKFPNDTTVLDLSGMRITDIPVGAFQRFFALDTL